MLNARVPATAGGLPTTFLPVSGSTRRRIEATIEHLVGLLDWIDGDSDREPSLGWTATGGWSANNDDREVEDEHDEDCGDAFEVTI